MYAENLVDSLRDVAAVFFDPLLIDAYLESAIDKVKCVRAHVWRIVRKSAFVVWTSKGAAFHSWRLLLQNVLPVGIDVPVSRP
jgi:hypothetical protein